MRQLDNNYGNKADQKECYTLLVKKLSDRWKEQYKSPPLLHGDTLLPFMENSVGDFIRNLSQMLITIRKNFRATEAAGGIITYRPHTRCSSVDGDRIQKRLATEDPAGEQLSKEQKNS